jgi:hypothetical protein
MHKEEVSYYDLLWNRDVPLIIVVLEIENLLLIIIGLEDGIRLRNVVR